MNRRYRRVKRYSALKESLIDYFEENLKEILIMSIIFFIGIVIGVVFINKCSDIQKEEITSYITSFIEDLKENKSINEIAFLISSIKRNALIAIAFWIIGLSIIGIPLVYFSTCFIGFCMGYSISSIILSLGIRERMFIFIFYIVFSKYNNNSLYNHSCNKLHKVT